MNARPVAGKWVGLIGALGLPLVFRLVPRNYLYGTRTARVIWLVVLGLRSVNP